MKIITSTLIATVFSSMFALSGCNKQAPAVEQAPAAEQAQTEEVAPAPHEFDAMPAAGTQARCPVMDHAFVVTETTESSNIDGKFYVFCCPGCKTNFDADPQSFLSKM